MRFARQTTRRRLLAAASLIAFGVAPLPVARAQGASSRGRAQATIAAPPAIVILGDSLSAEYGIARGSGWVSLLERRLASEGSKHRVVNASISGETTSGGRARIEDLLGRHRPAVVVVELGGNDALRGLDLGASERNLSEIVRWSRASGAKPLLLGMMVPPNYGRAYADRFSSMFRRVAATEKAALVPFFLEGVAERPEMFQNDRIHPNEKAQARLLDNVWPKLTALL